MTWENIDNEPKDEGEKTFLRITNKDIWAEIKSLAKNLEEFKESNAKGHKAIMDKQDKTNGNVLRNKLKSSFNRTLLYCVGIILLTMAGWIYTI